MDLFLMRGKKGDRPYEENRRDRPFMKFRDNCTVKQTLEKNLKRNKEVIEETQGSSNTSMRSTEVK